MIMESLQRNMFALEGSERTLYFTHIEDGTGIMNMPKKVDGRDGASVIDFQWIPTETPNKFEIQLPDDDFEVFETSWYVLTIELDSILFKDNLGRELSFNRL